MIILNINKFYFFYGGAERFFFELQKILAEKGHRVIPFAMQHPKNFTSPHSQYFVSEVQTKKISFSRQGLRTIARFFWSGEAMEKLKKVIALEKPNLAIVHNIYHQISPSILPLLKKNHIPVILIANDYGLLSPNYKMLVRGKIYDRICGTNFLQCLPDRCVDNSIVKSFICGLETWFHHSVLNVYRKNIDYVVCPSQFMLKMFLKAGWPKLKLIHLPYFIKQPVTNPLTLLEAGNLNPRERQKNYILFFGRLSPEKGVDLLIEAVKNLPQIKLKIAGVGPEKDNYELRIINYGLKNIELIGFKIGQELSELIAGAKFIVVPSIWYENYPLSVLESYALGIPALVADIGGLPEMIPDNDKNFLFESGNIKDLGEKINFLWQNNDLLAKAGDRARNSIEINNEPEKYYQKIMELYRNLK